MSLCVRANASADPMGAPRRTFVQAIDFPSSIVNGDGMFRIASLLVTSIACSFAPNAVAQEEACYDAEISASITGQTPTVMRDCDDCIIMRWPWFVALEVARTHFGDVARGPLTVLSVQHSGLRTDRGIVRWKLRNNTLGGFNVVGAFGSGPETRCPTGTPPARPFIDPGTQRTLDDIRREGEERYSFH
ncbi:MAG: hypothetical protein CMF74_03305 [Maricaulis sp.]|nr:hypothetical protein [Maricaulis sp.]